MKIGLSFGRCVRDLVEGKVQLAEVLVIIARTHMESETHVDGVIRAYMGRREYLGGQDEQACLEMGRKLYKSGKLFQPRLEGHYTGSAVREDYVWMDAMPTVHEDNEVVKKAWNSYQMALKLASQQQVPRQLEHNHVPQIDY